MDYLLILRGKLNLVVSAVCTFFRKISLHGLVFLEPLDMIFPLPFYFCFLVLTHSSHKPDPTDSDMSILDYFDTPTPTPAYFVGFVPGRMNEKKSSVRWAFHSFPGNDGNNMRTEIKSR